MAGIEGLATCSATVDYADSSATPANVNDARAD